ncbi:MAG: glycerophosphodiester phosphodiesterase [Sphingomonadales bacterium]
MLRWLLMTVMITSTATAAPPLSPIVIGHRGASGERPEHTLASYTRAIEEGADFIEPDLVMTKDHVLIVRHENEISGTTDVAAHPEFAARKATKTIDGQSVTGWFTEDFTLAEIKTLRARERLPQLRPENAKFDGQFEVPTFEEVIALAKARGVGVYPEIKHGTYFTGIGMNMEAPLLAALKKAGWTRKTDRVFIQSFEVGNLQRLRKLTKLRLVQLMDAAGGPADRPDLRYTTMATPAGLKAVAAYADAIGPAKAMIVPRDTAGKSLAPTMLVADAHAAGLKVHPWTFRAENVFLPAELRKGTNPAVHGDLAAEIRQFYALGVDGVFSDFPGIAVTSKPK